MAPGSVVRISDIVADGEADPLDRVFFALSDPVRRSILEHLDGQPMLVSELAAPFDISLQAVSRHIQVLVRAGLVRQERSGRISRCSLVSGPIQAASVWLNRYSKYWQDQFGILAMALEDIERERPKETAGQAPARQSKVRPSRKK